MIFEIIVSSDLLSQVRVYSWRHSSQWHGRLVLPAPIWPRMPHCWGKALGEDVYHLYFLVSNNAISGFPAQGQIIIMAPSRPLQTGAYCMHDIHYVKLLSEQDKLLRTIAVMKMTPMGFCVRISINQCMNRGFQQGPNRETSTHLLSSREDDNKCYTIGAA
jgi:hypothetical protein